MKVMLTSSIGGQANVDGSYILIEDGHETLYGEAYMIKDGQLYQICKDNEALILKQKQFFSKLYLLHYVWLRGQQWK